MEDLPVTDRHLEEISRLYCRAWKRLPTHLSLETIVADDIDKSLKEEEDKRYDFLKKWKKMKGSTATYRKLHDALKEIECVDDAEKVYEIMRRGQSDQESTDSGAASAVSPPASMYVVSSVSWE
jgi:hypothetical protein